MDDATYRQWWPLHLRVSNGETLEPEDQALYEAGLCHLHRDESIQADPAKLADLEQKIAAAERKNSELDQQRQALEIRVAQLQARRSVRQADSAGRIE